MKKTITIEIINAKVYNLLKDLESLHLIRFYNRKDDKIRDWEKKFKGKMQKQDPNIIDSQIKELRSSWE